MRATLVGLLATLGVSAGAPHPAAAAPDLNGLWRIGVYVTQSSGSFTDLCSVIITQTGTTFLLSGSCQGVVDTLTIRGTLDLNTGSFTGSGATGGCSQVNVSGTIAVDSASFSGTFSCPTQGLAGGVNASRCGNGQLDPGETCDDGNRVHGDCCSARCQLFAEGAACEDDGSLCTTDTCSAAGQCQHVARTGACNDRNPCTSGDTCNSGQCIGTVRPDDSTCNDGNGCTTGDRCSSGTCAGEPVVCSACLSCNVSLGCVPTITNACKQSSAHALVLRRQGTDTVSWKWGNGEATQDVELGDPTAATDYDFCIYDSSFDQEGRPGLVLSARAPAGSDWHATGNGFAYDRRDLTPDGLRRVLVRAGGVGKSRVGVKGLGPDLTLPQLSALAFPLTVQLTAKDGAGSQCWSAQYDRPAIHNPLLLKSGLKVRPPDTRPNILVISLDDTRADGTDRMPSLLSRVAAQGVSFTNSFAVDPLCAPSRASLLTGLHAHNHGVRALGGDIGGAGIFRERGSDRQTIATWLQAAGYMTGLFGKYINGYGFGPTEADGGPDGTRYVPPGWTRWRGMASPEHFGGQFGGSYTLIDEHGRATLYGDHATDQQYSTDFLASEVRRFMADAVQQGRPFLAVWTPYASHAETTTFFPEPAARHFGFFRGLPPWRPASWGEVDVSDKPRALQQLDNGPISAVLTDIMRVGAYETLLSVDEQLVLILDDLAALGIDDNTVIMVTSDNGVGWGEHRLFNQMKDCVYEECLRVPLIVRDPRVHNSPLVQNATVLNVDIAPTVAALASVTPPQPLDGMSFVPWLAGPPPAQWRDDFLYEHWRATRGDGVSYTAQVTDGDQLRIYYGNRRGQPRPSVLFEFDAGDGVANNTVAVPIAADADATFANLGTAVAAAVPFAASSPVPNSDRVDFIDNSPEHDGVFVAVERDQGAVMSRSFASADAFGVRDTNSGFTYVEHETGEVELYDFSVDPAQLENKAGDPSYADTQARLAARLNQLLR